MAFPADWIPPVSSGRRSFRFFKEATITNSAYDAANSVYFKDGQGANTFGVIPTVKAGQANTTGGYQQGEAINNPTAFPPTPAPLSSADHIWSATIRITNDGTGVLYYSFDGANDHGKLKSGESLLYRHRYEAGICLRTTAAATVTYRIEAW